MPAALLRNWRLVALAAVVLALIAGYYGVRVYGNTRYNAGVVAAQDRAQRAAMEQYITEIDRMITMTATLQGEITELRNAGKEIQTRYVTIRETSPIPDGCSAGPERLSVFTSAVRAANAER